MDVNTSTDSPFDYSEYEKYQNMSYEELLKELEKLNTQ